MHINIAKINFKQIGINIAKADFSLYDVVNYQDEYLTLSALEDGEITITIPAAINSSYATSLSYSKDKSTWTDTIIDDTAQTITIPVTSGENVYLKGIAKQLCNSNASVNINSTANIDASGNIMSLLYGDDYKDKVAFQSGSSYTLSELFYNNTHLINAKNLILSAMTLSQNCYYNMFNGCTSLTKAPVLPATTLKSNCYREMFSNCTSLVTAPELPATELASECYRYMFYGCTSLETAPELPATKLANYCYANMFVSTSLKAAPELPATTLAEYCYYRMFYNCTSLVTAHELPATVLIKGCYFNMFYNCTSLTTAPALPATALAPYCYNYMFQSCTSLVTAPELPATTLAEYCYQQMFNNCSKLNSITMLATDISAVDCLGNWVDGVAATGTFTKAASMTSLPTGSSGIPAGWTVVDYGAEKDYLCFTSTGDSTVAIKQGGDETPSASANKVIQYKLNDGQWQTLDMSAVSLGDGDKMYLKSDDEIPMSESRYAFKSFVMTGHIAASGNIMSLLNFSTTLDNYAFFKLFDQCSSLTTTPALPATTLAENCYNYMFSGCYSLTTAPELPATTLATSCYDSMFNGCASLTTAPELPATTLAESCYNSMFGGCKKLTTAPELPATTLATSCYANMFNGCTSLTTAPALPATTLAEYCYSNMFSGHVINGWVPLTQAPELPATTLAPNCYFNMFNCCKNLNYVKAMFTDVPRGALANWLKDVATTGTFVKNASATWTNEDAGIPTGWTVETASPDK